MPGIFICYRREDASPYAGRIYDHLSARFGAQRVFMDIDTIRPGDDFVQVISEKVAACDALIAVIGKRWLTSADARGRRRLEDPNDYVRIEIASALSRNVRVIPALVDGAQMPPATELPPDLAPLARRNAVEITNTLFRQNVERLIQVLEQTIRPGPLSFHRAFKMRMPVAREKARVQPAAYAPPWSIIAGAGAFLFIHLLRYSMSINSMGVSIFVSTLLQCGVLFVLLSFLGDPLDRKTVLRLTGCWAAAQLFLVLAGSVAFRPLVSSYGATAAAVGGVSAVLQTAAALVFGALVRLALPMIPWRPVFALTRAWGLGAVVLWIAGLMSSYYTAPPILYYLYRALIGGGIMWLIRQKR
jgi:hypothetical protein